MVGAQLPAHGEEQRVVKLVAARSAERMRVGSRRPPAAPQVTTGVPRGGSGRAAETCD